MNLAEAWLQDGGLCPACEQVLGSELMWLCCPVWVAKTLAPSGPSAITEVLWLPHGLCGSVCITVLGCGHCEPCCCF
jgi:hypothetical protein